MMSHLFFGALCLISCIEAIEPHTTNQTNEGAIVVIIVACGHTHEITKAFSAFSGWWQRTRAIFNHTSDKREGAVIVNYVLTEHPLANT